MKKLLRNGVLGAGLLAAQLTAPAADLDLYANPPSTFAADLPNVLFVIDNTANWNTAFTNEMLALKNTVHNMPANKFNIGIMFSTETGSGDSGNKGGYIRAAIRPMNTANKVTYEALINSFDKLADKSNGGASGLQMAEVWRYFSGGEPYAGNTKNKTDYQGSSYGTAASRAIYGLPGNALNNYSSATYNSPVAAGSCAKNYVIYISNGPNQENSSADTASSSMLFSAAGGGAAGTAATATITISPSGSQSNPMDEWGRFMKQSSMAITTFMIDVDPVTTGQGPGWSALLKSTSGAANYVKVTSGNGGLDIADAINNALSKIQSVNSVFAAVSLPASANVQGAYLNQLYIGMFRPDADSNPRWLGNLKQYETANDSSLVDSLGQSAISAQTGFIAECAVSYWTPPKPTAAGQDEYYLNDPKGACIPPGNLPDLYKIANSPDGNIVEKGGQAYRLRSGLPSARRVKTCALAFADCTSLIDFNSSVATVSALGAADATEQSALISFAKGTNVDAELQKTTTERRPSIHGDVIHSNPLALSYDSDVIVYYGSNDGMLHAINGNRTANYGSYLPGQELWAFMPPEYFPNIKRIRDNTEKISITPPVGSPRTGSPKPYGIDGPITYYRENGQVSIYATMRRGGRAVYSFNVATPGSPSLAWKSGCSNDATPVCTSGAEQIGQTWSTARPTKALGYSSGSVPVLIMGGGYDDCEDPDVNTCTAASKGHSVMVLNAANGAVLASLNTDRPVVTEVKIMPDDNGYAKYAYAADLGGNIYRITIGSAAPADWTILKIASLGCATTAACTDNRKFMFSPSLISEADGTIGLYLGSGDREKPLGPNFFPHSNAVSNYFFQVKDKPDDPDWLTSERGNCQGNDIICLASLTSVGAVDGTCGAATAPTGKGYLLALRPTEQVVTLAATRFGVTTFSTHMPDVPVAGACTAKLGTVHVYNLNIATATPSTGSTCSDVLTGGGLPPPPEKLDVCVDAACLLPPRPICIGCHTCPTCTDPNPPPVDAVSGNAKRRVYWYIQK